MAPARLFYRPSRIPRRRRVGLNAPRLAGSRGRGSETELYSVWSIASALETAYSPGFSTLSALTTPFSTSIA